MQGWIFIMISHWSNSPLVDMLFHLDRLSWLRVDNLCCYSSVWLSDRQLFSFIRLQMKQVRVKVILFISTFNNISVSISWQSVFLMEETGENHRPAASNFTDKLSRIMLYRVYLAMSEIWTLNLNSDRHN